MNKNNETCQDCKKSCCKSYLIKKTVVLILLAIISFISLKKGYVLIKNQILDTLLISFIVGGTLYYFDLYIIYFWSCNSKLERSKKKKFCLFSIIYISILSIFNVCFVLFNESIENSLEKEQIIQLIVIMLLDLIMITSLFLFYFYYCLKEVKKFRILLIEKSIRSELVAVTAWLLIATNIGAITISCDNINKIFLKFYIIVAAPITLLYPFFDIFEFTYKQLNEIEEEKTKNRKRRKKANRKIK